MGFNRGFVPSIFVERRSGMNSFVYLNRDVVLISLSDCFGLWNNLGVGRVSLYCCLAW